MLDYDYYSSLKRLLPYAFTTRNIIVDANVDYLKKQESTEYHLEMSSMLEYIIVHKKFRYMPDNDWFVYSLNFQGIFIGYLLTHATYY